MRNVLLPIILLMIVVSSVFANVSLASENAKLVVENGYARESIPGTSISSAYMTIKNLSAKNIRLIGAASAVSDRIEIHQHTMSDGLMRMRQRDYVEISAQNSTVFQPSGFHLMIFDLKQPLKAKENIIITLSFDDQSSRDVNYTVQGLKQKKHEHH
ncbi:copper chaperone PCu(A)C [Colwellia sp. MB02u-18]|uniref:copper chaperone PCu(A)C n=1 Tax=unclassified Colwellia TaxID=196834 RepID=UPI0015F35502|nr:MULTISPECIES: copper chaperone PCu(A)C [unclassified Colwellia]MBA6223445.1 copper chaperone PCu(A)C [Colwellia sp. MB3u-45]MBA6267970.1 copper chaperone PCu(A)C [Colwellia sp. MB3u-43]MBA6321629.1 copper chaperone PCu(A)C [Colwellia sp. MB02u-19]MBA6325372.1 copper chaperone PCu(A)C [Colwellia sp. MB02u-18]MBA6330039.1 copper chaperone PCu(A)C [Colwellia sp. MB02u-12]